MKLRKAVEQYCQFREVANGTRKGYETLLRKWDRFGGPKKVEEIDKKTVRLFLDWVYEEAVKMEGKNPGRTHNKAREILHAVLAWAANRDVVESQPTFPETRRQRDVAGKYCLTHEQLSALYQATYKLRVPRGWDRPEHIGLHWRVGLVMWFNYGVDTGTLMRFRKEHEPICWRHIEWSESPPMGTLFSQPNPWGWIFYRRTKTRKSLWRPMNETVHRHIKMLTPGGPDETLLSDCSRRPCWRFHRLCDLAGIGCKIDIETGAEIPWVIKDLRKTCGTHHQNNIPGSAKLILAHTDSDITTKHYADTSGAVMKALLSLPQPSAFLQASDDCPCCKRTFEPLAAREALERQLARLGKRYLKRKAVS